MTTPSDQGSAPPPNSIRARAQAATERANGVSDNGIWWENTLRNWGEELQLNRPEVHTYLSPSALAPYAEHSGGRPGVNDWYGDSEKTDAMKRVLGDQGMRDPIVLTTDGTRAVVTEGNHRLAAALEMGLDKVPVQFAPSNDIESAGLGLLRDKVPPITDALRAEAEKVLFFPSGDSGVIGDDMMTLYHRTSEANAASILEHGFDSSLKIPDPNRTMYTRSRPDPNTFFSDQPQGEGEGYGDTTLKVDVPKDSVRLDPNFDTYKGETFYVVKNENLKGLPVEIVPPDTKEQLSRGAKVGADTDALADLYEAGATDSPVGGVAAEKRLAKKAGPRPSELGRGNGGASAGIAEGDTARIPIPRPGSPDSTMPAPIPADGDPANRPGFDWSDPDDHAERQAWWKAQIKIPTDAERARFKAEVGGDLNRADIQLLGGYDAVYGPNPFVANKLRRAKLALDNRGPNFIEDNNARALRFNMLSPEDQKMVREFYSNSKYNDKSWSYEDLKRVMYDEHPAGPEGSMVDEPGFFPEPTTSMLGKAAGAGGTALDALNVVGFTNQTKEIIDKAPDSAKGPMTLAAIVFGPAGAATMAGGAAIPALGFTGVLGVGTAGAAGLMGLSTAFGSATGQEDDSHPFVAHDAQGNVLPVGPKPEAPPTRALKDTPHGSADPVNGLAPYESNQRLPGASSEDDPNGRNTFGIGTSSPSAFGPGGAPGAHDQLDPVWHPGAVLKNLQQGKQSTPDFAPWDTSKKPDAPGNPSGYGPAPATGTTWVPGVGPLPNSDPRAQRQQAWIAQLSHQAPQPNAHPSGYGTRWHAAVQHPDGTMTPLPLRMQSSSPTDTHWEVASDYKPKPGDKVVTVQHPPQPKPAAPRTTAHPQGRG